MKSNLQRQAEVLRRQGYLFSEIASKLKVSPSTAHVWTDGLALTAREARHLLYRKNMIQQVKMANLSASRHAHYLEREQVLQLTASKIIKKTTLTPDLKRLTCALLYWCEGTKDVSSGIRFTNADPVLIRTFMSLLRTSFEINEAKFRALLHLHEYHDQAEQISYWVEITGIPQQQFHKTYIKPHTGKNKQLGYPGCISVRYLDASLGKLLKMIYSEYGQTL